jgi:hypothetical protein
MITHINPKKVAYIEAFDFTPSSRYYWDEGKKRRNGKVIREPGIRSDYGDSTIYTPEDLLKEEIVFYEIPKTFAKKPRIVFTLTTRSTIYTSFETYDEALAYADKFAEDAKTEKFIKLPQ